MKLLCHLVPWFNSLCLTHRGLSSHSFHPHTPGVWPRNFDTGTGQEMSSMHFAWFRSHFQLLVISEMPPCPKQHYVISNKGWRSYQEWEKNLGRSKSHTLKNKLRVSSQIRENNNINSWMNKLGRQMDFNSRDDSSKRDIEHEQLQKICNMSE